MKYKVNEFIEIKKLGTKYIIYNKSNSESHVVNELAGEIFTLLAEKSDTQDVKCYLVNKYPEVSDKTIEKDLDELLIKFMELHLISTLAFVFKNSEFQHL